MWYRQFGRRSGCVCPSYGDGVQGAQLSGASLLKSLRINVPVHFWQLWERKLGLLIRTWETEKNVFTVASANLQLQIGE